MQKSYTVFSLDRVGYDEDEREVITEESEHFSEEAAMDAVSRHCDYYAGERQKKQHVSKDYPRFFIQITYK